MSASKKLRELNRARQEHDSSRLMLQIETGRVSLENIAESVMAKRIEELEREVADALDCRSGTGPTALAMVLAERDQLRDQVKMLRDCIQLLYSWANNWDSEFMNDPDWKNRDVLIIQEALAATEPKE